jgi:hypothetical protein
MFPIVTHDSDPAKGTSTGRRHPSRIGTLVLAVVGAGRGREKTLDEPSESIQGVTERLIG